MPPNDIGRRIRAARALAEFPSVDDLARAIDESGLGTKTLRAIERGERPAQPRDLRAIAAACDVSVEFLTGPDELVRHPAGDGERTRADAMTALDARLVQLLEGLDAMQRFADRRVEGASAVVLERFDRLEYLLTENADRRAALEDLADLRGGPATSRSDPDAGAGA